MSLSIDEVTSLLCHSDATYCVQQLEQWLTTLTNKPYLQTQSFYPCYTLICTRIFSKLPVNQSNNQSNNKILPPLIRSHPAICSINSPLFQLIFKHAAFPPYFGFSLDQLPRSTRATILNNQSINQSPIASRFSSCFDRSKNQLDLSIQEYFMFMFALAAHDPSVNQPINQPINQPKVEATYESLIRQYLQAFDQSDNLDTFLAIAIELWLGFSIIVRDRSINQTINQTNNQLDLVPMSSARMFIPQMLADHGRLGLDTVLVRSLHSSFLQLRGPFDQKTANLLQLWLDALSTWQSNNQSNNQSINSSTIDPADLALAIALHSSMFLSVMRSLTTIDLGREGSSSRSFAFELVTRLIKLVMSFESCFQSVQSTLNESTALQQALSRPRGLGATPTTRVEERAAAIRGHYIRLIGDLNDVDGIETTIDTFDSLVSSFQQQSQLVCLEFAREMSPRARAGVIDPNWQQFTSTCRLFVGPELDSVLTGDKRAPANSQVHVEALQQQSLEPERDQTSRLTAAGVKALASGTALCSRRALPARGDPWDLPVTSHENEFVLDVIRQVRSYCNRYHPEWTFVNHKQWRALARHENLMTFASVFALMILIMWMKG